MTRRTAAAVAVAAVLCLAVAPASVAARLAVGVVSGADREHVAHRLARAGATGITDLRPIPALAVTAPKAAVLRGITGVRYVEVLESRREAFVPNDPLFDRQWYATQNRAFDAWTELPPLAPVRVAVIDSGIDGAHPELQAKVVAARSFVGGSPKVDIQGHGTFVAGLIAAEVNDGVGIAGLAPPAELVIAKVVGPERSIPVEAEAKAIRWAVARGARVINMSLGGLRDPRDSSRDTYSQLEADAVAYAVQKGVLVVAAVGNSDQSPSQPWPYASWPAALPHVLGVSALDQRGRSPLFSNRDAQFNDIAAPGAEILSTFPRALTGRFPDCLEQGYSSCGPAEYRDAEGTSFATPQVTAAAAVLLATLPGLAADQVAALLQQGAVDAIPANGCLACPGGRDRFTGAGRLDETAALELLSSELPPRDRYEPNDGAAAAYTLFGAGRRIDATLDYYNDRADVYRVYLRRGQRLRATTAAGVVRPAVALWRPGTESIDEASAMAGRLAVGPAGGPLRYRAGATGWYLLDVRITRPDAGAYVITVSKSR